MCLTDSLRSNEPLNNCPDDEDFNVAHVFFLVKGLLPSFFPTPYFLEGCTKHRDSNPNSERVVRDVFGLECSLTTPAQLHPLDTGPLLLRPSRLLSKEAEEGK
jgi:hypothetical protein